MQERVIERGRRDLERLEVGRFPPFAKRRMVGSMVFFNGMGRVDPPRG
jgi:hypothetical protein